MELNKKKYKQIEVRAMFDAYKNEYENRLAEQRGRISELNKENAELKAELDLIKDKQQLIYKTLERAEKNATELEQNALAQYELEVERLRSFSERWNGYFNDLKEKYPLYSTIKKAVGIKERMDELVDEANPKTVVEELDKMLGKTKKKAFDPKGKIRDYIAATGDNGFNLDEVLNPGELQLEDLCKELGLIDGNE